MTSYPSKLLLAVLCTLLLNVYTFAGQADGENSRKETRHSRNYHREARRGKRAVKILAIGNSWSVNGTHYMGEILDNLGIPADIQISFKGGCPLSVYWENVGKEEPLFRHDRWSKETGWQRGRDGKTHTLKDLVTSDDFDIITLQQASHDAGRYFTYQPYANNLIEWLGKTAAHQPIIFFQSTWAYPNGAAHRFFPKYDKDSEKMYRAILTATDSLMQETGIYRLMPTCPLIQQLRLIPGMPRIDTPDGTHLANVGEYAASCLWVESLLRQFYDSKFIGRKSIKDCTFKIDQLTEEQAETIRRKAYEVVNHQERYYKSFIGSCGGKKKK